MNGSGCRTARATSPIEAQSGSKTNRHQLFATVRMLSRMVQSLNSRGPRKTGRNKPD